MTDRERRRLQDIVEHARRAARYLGEASADELEADDRRFSAILWCMVVIGEAAAQAPLERLDPRTADALVEARRMRNMLIHRYPEIEPHQVAATIRDDLPPLIAELEALLREQPE